jgi:hypothetical protein
LVRGYIVGDFGFEAGWKSNFDRGDIELKFSFRKDDWINKREGTVREGFD